MAAWHFLCFVLFFYDMTWMVNVVSCLAELPCYPGYFREPHWLSMGLMEISRVTWQLWSSDFSLQVSVHPTYILLTNFTGNAQYILPIFPEWFSTLFHCFITLFCQPLLFLYCNIEMEHTKICIHWACVLFHFSSNWMHGTFPYFTTVCFCTQVFCATGCYMRLKCLSHWGHFILSFNLKRMHSVTLWCY